MQVTYNSSKGGNVSFMLKGGKVFGSLESESSSRGQIDVSRVTKSIADMKVTARDDLSGSQRSLPFKKDKMREKDCSCM